MTSYVITEEDIETLFTYFQAAINGEENEKSLKRLFDVQCGAMRSQIYNVEADRANMAMRVWELAIRKRVVGDPRKVELPDLWDILQDIIRGV